MSPNFITPEQRIARTVHCVTLSSSITHKLQTSLKSEPITYGITTIPTGTPLSSSCARTLLAIRNADSVFPTAHTQVKYTQHIFQNLSLTRNGSTTAEMQFQRLTASASSQGENKSMVTRTGTKDAVNIATWGERRRRQSSRSRQIPP